MARQICQSCSRPLNDQNKGTEGGGSQSQKYCSLCYLKGKFITPDMTVKQMQEIVVRVLNKEKHWPKFLAKLASKQIPKLERWKKV